MVFKKGHPLYNTGKTYFKIGMIPWNKGLTKETDERIRNLALSRLGKNNPMYGKKQTEETKRKRSESMQGKNKGKYHNEKIRKKISESHKGKSPWNKGKKNIYSKETKKKIKRARAKQIFPIKDTKIEVKIQDFLKELGIEFFTHQYMKIEHGYQCDIFIPSKNLVIECDGTYWHKYPIGTEIDHIRTSELIQKGFKVLRLWEFEINEMTIEEFKGRLK